MNKIELLDCTLRDGGYINDWFFGESAIKFILKKLEQSNRNSGRVSNSSSAN